MILSANLAVTVVCELGSDRAVGRAVVVMRFPFRAALGPALLVLAASGCAGFDPNTQRVEPEGEDVAAAPSALDISVFNLPPSDASERAAIVAKYPALDPTGLIRRGLLEDAIEFFDINK